MDSKDFTIMPKTDLGRLNIAVERLRALGYIVADGGCCLSCNWRALLEPYPDHEGPVINFHDQSLARAFGERELTTEYALRMELIPCDDEEAQKALFEEAYQAGAFVRDEVQFGELWISHHGLAEHIRRAVSVLREEGLDASWNGDERKNICIRPRWDAVVKEKRLTALEGYISDQQAMIEYLEQEGKNTTAAHAALARLVAELGETQKREVAG
jgi:hypothetical protein